MNEQQTKEQQRRFDKWRQRTLKSIPTLATRVFALRSVPYPGYGFHYSMEAELGYCLSELARLDSERYLFILPDVYGPVLSAQIIIQVRTRMLFAWVAKAEQSVTAHN